MSRLARNLFRNRISDKLAVGIPTPQRLLSKTLYKTLAPGISTSFGEELRRISHGNKTLAKKMLADDPSLKTQIKSMVSKANTPYPGKATQALQDKMFPQFLRQRMTEIDLLPKTAQNKIKSGLNKIAQNRGYTSLEDAMFADLPEVLPHLK